MNVEVEEDEKHSHLLITMNEFLFYRNAGDHFILTVQNTPGVFGGDFPVFVELDVNGMIAFSHDVHGLPTVDVNRLLVWHQDKPCIRSKNNRLGKPSAGCRSL